MSDVCVPTGWVLMFVLGMVLLFNGVTYATGETEITNYYYDSYNYTDYDGEDNTTEIHTEFEINSTTTTKTAIYTSFQEGSEPIIAGLDSAHLIGFLLVILGGFGFMTFWFDTKRERQEAEE